MRDLIVHPGQRRLSLITIVVLILTALQGCQDRPTPELPPAVNSMTPVPPTLTGTPGVTRPPAETTSPGATPTALSFNLTPMLDDPSTLPSPTATATVLPLGPFSDCPVDDASGVSPGGPLHVLIFNDLGAWRWDNTTQAVSAVSLPPDARSPVPSPDGDRFAYTIANEDGSVALWVMDEDGGVRRQLATVSIVDYLSSSPDYVTDAVLSYRWLADRDILVYQITPILGAFGELAIETVTAADIVTAEAWTLVPGGAFDHLVFHPEGMQVAAIGDDTVQFIDARSGALQHEIALRLYDFWYSAAYAPGGDSLVIFTEGGIALIDPTSGDVEPIALKYAPIGMGHSALMPEIAWSNDGQSFYTFIAPGDSAIDIFAPEATFTLWRVDIAEATAQSVRTFQGALPSARLSPDRQRLTFWSQRQDNVRTLYLANLTSAEQVAYDRMHTLEFLNWHPDSTRFTYWEFPERAPILGHLCQMPLPLGDLHIPFAGAIYWLGPERFVAVEGVDRGAEVTGPWEIRLRSLDGENRLLHTVQGAAPQIRFGP